jgi:4a-hydroxytetrahydrobiopterin dehydratase
VTRPRPPLLAEADAQALMAAHPGWRRDGGWLAASFRWPTFRAAVAFTQRLAEVAEALDHHPEWTVRWRVVEVRTTTHDAGGLTARDAALVAAIDALAAAAPR